MAFAFHTCTSLLSTSVKDLPLPRPLSHFFCSSRPKLSRISCDRGKVRDCYIGWLKVFNQTACSPPFLLSSVEYFIPSKQALSQKVAVKRKTLRTTVSTRPSPHRFRPNFVSSVLLSSQTVLFRRGTREKRSASSLCSNHLVFYTMYYPSYY